MYIFVAHLTSLSFFLLQWSAYTRHLVRKARGLTLLVDQLNHSHDTVVRSSATALRNLAVDYTNKMMIGQCDDSHVYMYMYVLYMLFIYSVYALQT